MKALAALLLLAIMLWGAIVWLSRRRHPRIDKAYFAERWQMIGGLCQEADVQWAVAIIEADKLLDEALKRLGYAGKTTGERLASATRHLSNADGIWLAHKLRNKVVHETGIQLNKKQLSLAMRGYRRALKDLGVL